MLEEYEKKRHFEKTPEPSARGSQGSIEKPIFVVQRHDARNLHYDFRLGGGWSFEKLGCAKAAA